MKRTLILIIIITFLSFGCIAQEKQAETGNKIKIAVTSFPLYDFTKNIVGDNAEIWMMLPPGLNAHSYEPKPKDIERLNIQDAIIFTNKYFEVWEEKTFGNLDNKNVLIIDSSKNVELLAPDDETLGPIDPHTWLSPKNAKLMIEEITSKLGKKYPEKKELFSKNAEEYLKKLNKLDYDFTETTKKCTQKQMMVSHAAFGYMARHYNLTQIPIIKNFDPQGEVSIKDLETLIKKAKEMNVKHIFFEDFISPKVSEEIAKEINGKTVLFSPMEAYSEQQLKNDSYVGVMTRNLEEIKDALNCR